ncbi:MAG TPA: radical SAM protein [Methanomassiliicoccales archaeon]|jgi:anaerobic magnesium-protoporphyrin IX monomethyl ester cyclase
MSEVVLIAPYDHTTLRERLGLKAPPLNLLYLASSLRQNGFSVKIIDDNVKAMGPEELARNISPNTRIVGLTAATSTLNSAVHYADAIKSRDEGIVTVLGGPHVSFLPEETLEHGKGIDIAVMGEGEDTVVDLVSTLEKGHDLENVKGIAFKANDKIVVNRPREMRPDIDAFPIPARDLIRLDDYKDPVKKKPIGTMITSRGCVFGCSYCASSRMMGSRFRARSPTSIVDEMEILIEMGVEHIEFIDDIFVLNQKRATEIAKEIIRRGLDIKFTASSRVDTLSTPLLADLKKAGLSSLYLGIESGSQRVLDLMGKGTTLAQVHDAVDKAKEVDLNVLGSFILGYPGETLREMDDTIRLAVRLRLDFAQFSLLTPYPGTPIFESMRSRGLLLTEDYDRFTVVDPVIDYDKLGVGRKAVSRKIVMAYLIFYTRPSYMFKHPYLFKMIPRALFPRDRQFRPDRMLATPSV